MGETSKISRNQIGFNRATQKRCPYHFLFLIPVSYLHQLKYDSLGWWSSLICDTQAAGSNVMHLGFNFICTCDCKLQETSKSGLARGKCNQGVYSQPRSPRFDSESEGLAYPWKGSALIGGETQGCPDFAQSCLDHLKKFPRFPFSGH